MARIPFKRSILAVTCLSGGCALTETEILEPDDVIVAEVQVVLTLAPNDDVSLDAWALLHRAHRPRGAQSLSGAEIEVLVDSSRVVRLWEQQDAGLCIAGHPRSWDLALASDTVCFRAEAARTPFAPGERLSVRITVPDGRVLTGFSRLPGLGSRC